MATMLKEFRKSDDRAERARLKSLLAELEKSERERRRTIDRLAALIEQEKAKSAELRRQLPDLFD